MSKFRVQIDITEYYTYVTEVEANSQEEALGIAEQIDGITNLEKPGVLYGSDTDYIITEKDEL